MEDHHDVSSSSSETNDDAVRICEERHSFRVAGRYLYAVVKTSNEYDATEKFFVNKSDVAGAIVVPLADGRTALLLMKKKSQHLKYKRGIVSFSKVFKLSDLDVLSLIFPNESVDPVKDFLKTYQPADNATVIRLGCLRESEIENAKKPQLKRKLNGETNNSTAKRAKVERVMLCENQRYYFNCVPETQINNALEFVKKQQCVKSARLHSDGRTIMVTICNSVLVKDYKEAFKTDEWYLVKKLMTKRYDYRSNSTHVLLCSPYTHTSDALNVIRGTPGVTSAILGDAEGTINVTISADQRFQRYADCFDGDGWDVTENLRQNRVSFFKPVDGTLGTSEAAFQVSGDVTEKLRQKRVSFSKRLHGTLATTEAAIKAFNDLPWTTGDMLDKLCLSEDEMTNLPFLTWFYSQMGANWFNFDVNDTPYMAFTADSMIKLG
ncbi:hypothetical protein RRG08_004461 [Elysia crispata]|uniref:Uncharacterized protein n=1 Tax=Elysia crispata TaxID=231223 RepID=A0AAE1AXW2_9GAST|nr:hypothetical protein RRG08_004461 [Elysia crispata]